MNNPDPENLSGKYILDANGEPEWCADLMRWANWMESSFDQCRVAHDTIDGVRISTVFLALDHSWIHPPDPKRAIFWETMIFVDNPALDGVEWDHDTDRCGGSREQALAQHRDALEQVKAALALVEK